MEWKVLDNFAKLPCGKAEPMGRRTVNKKFESMSVSFFCRKLLITLAVDAELLKLNTSKTSRKWILLSANPLSLYRIASLSNDGDVKENGKKALGLLNNNFARASRFFVLISLQSLHDYDAKFPNFMRTWTLDRK